MTIAERAVRVGFATSNTAVDATLSETGRRNELPVALFRLLILLAILWLDFETGLPSHDGNHRLILIASYGVGSVIGVLMAVVFIAPTWLRHALSFLDAAALAASISIIEAHVGISKDHVMLLPVFSLVFIILTHAALRYSYALLLNTAVSFVGVLFLADFVGSVPANLPIDAAIVPRVLNYIPRWVEYRSTSIVSIVVGSAMLAFMTYQTRGMLRLSLARERRMRRLSSYVPPAVVHEVDQGVDALALRPYPDVVVLFSDLVGFTKLVETSTSRDVVEMLSRFHEITEASVFEHGGTLHKFLGDGVMCTFDTPDQHGQNATNAIACALKMIGDLEALNRERELSRAPPLRLSVGIHIGEVHMGQIGSARRMEYAVVGDVVNVASRLETITRTLGASIAVSDELLTTARRGPMPRLGQLTRFRRIGPKQLPGRSQRTDVWVWGDVGKLTARGQA